MIVIDEFLLKIHQRSIQLKVSIEVSLYSWNRKELPQVLHYHDEFRQSQNFLWRQLLRRPNIDYSLFNSDSKQFIQNFLLFLALLWKTVWDQHHSHKFQLLVLNLPILLFKNWFKLYANLCRQLFYINFLENLR